VLLFLRLCWCLCWLVPMLVAQAKNSPGAAPTPKQLTPDECIRQLLSWTTITSISHKTSTRDRCMGTGSGRRKKFFHKSFRKA
jgi:hypothetical protein